MNHIIPYRDSPTNYKSYSDNESVIEIQKFSDVRITLEEPNTILKCRSRDKINHMDKSIDLEESKEEKQMKEKGETIEVVDDTQYMLAIQFYFLYLLYGLIGGVIFNSFVSAPRIINFDMIFNCIISPIIYYHSPKHILMKIDKTILLFCYTPCFILGLCFRFLDVIPEINQFTLNLVTIDSLDKMMLSILVLIVFLGICAYYIYKSRYPKINATLFILYSIATTLSFYFFYNNGGTIYFHHYFIGLLVMIISRNYHSNIVVIIHAIAYGVYIDGISRWGYASIYS